MIYVPSGESPSPTGTFYIANNGGIAYSTGTPADSTSFSTVLNQTYLGGVTLVLPDEADNGLLKIRPGQKGVPALVNYRGALYMARNLAVEQTAANETVQSSAELWECTENCTVDSNWNRVALSSHADFTYYTDTDLPGIPTGSSSNNIAISLLQVNGDSLYIGFDNPADGITIWKASSAVSSESDFTQQGVAGLGSGNTYPYIFSSSSLNKIGK